MASTCNICVWTNPWIRIGFIGLAWRHARHLSPVQRLRSTLVTKHTGQYLKGTSTKTYRNVVFTFCSALSQFFVYFIYFTLLTIMYFVGAAIVIFRHYRNQPREEGVTTGQPVELCPAGADSETEALSVGAQVWWKGWWPTWISRVFWLDPPQNERILCSGWRGLLSAQSESWSVWSCSSQPAGVQLYQTCLALTGSLPSRDESG